MTSWQSAFTAWRGLERQAAPLLPEEGWPRFGGRGGGSACLERRFTAKDSWEKLDDNDKRWTLQKLSEIDLKVPLQTVMVIDPTGRPVGDISYAGISIHSEPPMAAEEN